MKLKNENVGSGCISVAVEGFGNPSYNRWLGILLLKALGSQ